MKTFKTPKGTELPMISLKGKDYLEVKWRLVWMREEHPNWTIETQVKIEYDKKFSVGFAIIRDDTGRALASAHKFENEAGFSDFIEKSETGAIGRALALCGYGTQFAQELEEEHRVVDSPVEPKKPFIPNVQSSGPSPARAVPNPPRAFNPGVGAAWMDYVIPFGGPKTKGQLLGTLRLDQIQNNLAYWETRIAADNKPAEGKMKEYLDTMKWAIADLEQQGEKAFNQASFEAESDLPF